MLQIASLLGSMAMHNPVSLGKVMAYSIQSAFGIGGGDMWPHDGNMH